MKRAGPKQSPWLPGIGVLLAIVLFPRPAGAHLNTSGMGPVYDGLLHFALSPEDILAVLVLAMFAGQRGAVHGRWTLFVLPGAWLAGGLFGLTANATAGTALTPVSFLLPGALLAADAALPLLATSALAGLTGLFHGYLNGAGMGRAADGALALPGLVFAVFVLVALGSSFVISLRRQWLRIAVRVAGSWTVAIGLLLLGWAFRRS